MLQHALSESHRNLITRSRTSESARRAGRTVRLIVIVVVRPLTKEAASAASVVASTEEAHCVGGAAGVRE